LQRSLQRLEQIIIRSSLYNILKDRQ